MKEKIENLEVIGHHDVFDEDWLPTRACPLYKLRGQDLYVHEFTVVGDEVEFDEFENSSRLDYWVDREWVTVFPNKEVFAAKPNHTLFIDHGMIAKYEPTDVVRAAFEKISIDCREAAIKALSDLDIKTANENAHKAHMIDSIDIRNIAMTATVGRLKGNKAREGRMIDVADQRGEQAEFKRYFDTYLALWVDSGGAETWA